MRVLSRDFENALVSVGGGLRGRLVWDTQHTAVAIVGTGEHDLLAVKFWSRSRIDSDGQQVRDWTAAAGVVRSQQRHGNELQLQELKAAVAARCCALCACLSMAAHHNNILCVLVPACCCPTTHNNNNNAGPQ